MNNTTKPQKSGSPGIEQIKQLRAKAKLLEPMVRIGKNGLTPSVIEHIQKLIKKRKLVKIKLLKSFMEENDRKAASATLAQETGTEIIEQVGFVVVLYRR